MGSAKPDLLDGDDKEWQEQFERDLATLEEREDPALAEAASALVELEAEQSNQPPLLERVEKATFADNYSYNLKQETRIPGAIDFSELRSLLLGRGKMSGAEQKQLTDAFSNTVGSYLADVLLGGGPELLDSLERLHTKLQGRYGVKEGKEFSGAPLFDRISLGELLMVHTICGEDFERILNAFDLSNVNDDFTVMADEGLYGECSIFGVGGDKKTGEFFLKTELFYSNGGHIERDMIQNIGDDGKKHLSVEARKFEIPEELQGRGIGKEILRRSLKLYDELGVEEINLMAGQKDYLKLGPYVWARYGFIFDKRVFGVEKIQECIGRAKTNASDALTQLGLLDTIEGQDALRAYDELLAHPDTVTPYQLSEIGKNIVFFSAGQDVKLARIIIEPYQEEKTGQKNQKSGIGEYRAVYLGQYAMFDNPWAGTMDISIGPNGEKTSERERLERYLNRAA